MAKPVLQLRRRAMIEGAALSDKPEEQEPAADGKPSELRMARLRRGWTAVKVATLSGLSRRTIMRLERGDPVTAETMLRASRVLGVVHPQDLKSEKDMRFGRAMRELRREAEESLETIATAIGCSAATLSRVERGSPPKFGWEDLLSSDDLARSLGLRDANDLMGRVGFFVEADRIV